MSEPLSEKNILIVDDSTVIIELLGSVLGEDYDLSVSTNGQRALEMVASQQPDLILLDIVMPGMDGFEVCRRLKADDVTRDIPVIFITMKIGVADEAQGLAVGAVDFITKPISPSVVRARVKTHLELKQQREAARSASKAKSDFIANMSHEIRTPMNAIVGFTELALRDELPPKIYNYLSKVKSASHSLLALINDILDFSKMDVGKLDLDPVTFYLHDLMDRQTNLFSLQLSDVELIFLVPPDFNRALFGDVRRVEQVLINLIRNAIKFTEKGSIIVSVHLIDQSCNRVSVKFSVQDSGIGIDPEWLPKLFLPFVQADNSTTRKYGGTGLGLAICKNLVEMLGGTIWAESVPGEGSIFSFNISLEYSKETSKNHPILPDHLLGMNVLVVTPHLVIQQQLQEMFKAFSCNAHLVSSGEEALSKVMEMTIRGEKSYDLIVIDSKLPRLDGVETVHRIMETLSLVLSLVDFPKFLLMTDLGAEETSQRAISINIVSKPISRQQLFHRVLEVFGEKVMDTDGASQQVLEASDTSKAIGGARILLVEDNSINQEVVRELLERVELVVEIANNGQEGVDKVKQDLFDLVLMDVQMPIMDGHEATQKIRQDPRFKKLPIIAMTAFSMPDEQKACLDAGMDAYLPKPIRPERLYGLLTQWIGPILIKDNPIEYVEESEDTSTLQIPGINCKEGLSRVAGNNALYLQLLDRFREDQSQALDWINRALADGDKERVISLVHGIKGVAGNIGATTLHRIAESLEKAFKREDQSLTEPILKAFSEAFTQVLDGLSAFNRMNTASADTLYGQSLSKKVTVDLEKLEPLLMELGVQLREYSIETDPFMEPLRELLSGSPFVPALRALEKCMRRYDFEMSRQALDNLVDELGVSLKKQP